MGGMKSWHLEFQKFNSFASPQGPILLKCEVIGVLVNIGQKISYKQYVSIILTIHLNAGINEVKVCSSKCRHTTCRTSESRDARLHSTKFVATQQPRSKPSRLQNLGLLQERVYKTSINDVDELRRQIAEECDKLDQSINKAVAEWRKRLRACVAAGGRQFGHKM